MPDATLIELLTQILAELNKQTEVLKDIKQNTKP